MKICLIEVQVEVPVNIETLHGEKTLNYISKNNTKIITSTLI